jgi:hypothetical protein
VIENQDSFSLNKCALDAGIHISRVHLNLSAVVVHQHPRCHIAWRALKKHGANHLSSFPKRSPFELPGIRRSTRDSLTKISTSAKIVDVQIVRPRKHEFGALGLGTKNAHSVP